MEQQLDRPIVSSARLPHGISVGRSRSAKLVKPFRGMRIERDVDSTTARLHAFAVHRRTDFAFSHSTAAAIYGLPLPSWSSESIHVTVPAGCRPPVVRGFVGHKLAHWHTVEVEGLPVTTPEQTWLDLATMPRHDDLVVVGDHLVGGPHALTDRERLRRAISESAGRRGTGHARLALESVRTGSESPGETRLRLMLVHAGLPEPSLNYRILDTRGRTYDQVPLDNEWALKSGTPVPAGDTIPAPETVAKNGPIEGSLVLFEIDEAANENRPLILEVPGPDGHGEIVLDL